MAQEIVIVGDDGTEHVFPSGFDPVRAAAIVRSRNVTPVSADEPSTYIAGALKGAKEGILGGAKGFAEGMLQSPASFAKGIVSMLTTNPVTTVKDAIAAIERLPDAVRSAGADPEAWGQGVGDVTGQTMIGLAGPRAVKAGVQAAPAALRTVGAAAAIPAGAAIGGTVGGPVGAAVGAGLGGLAREAIQAIPPSAAETAATAASAAAQRLTAALSSGEAIPAAKFFELLRQVPPNERAAVLAARQAAVAASAPAPAPPAAAPVPPQAAAPIAQPAPAAPAVAPVSRPVAFQSALKAFEAAGAQPQPAEVSNAAAMMKFGKSAEEAVAAIVKARGKSAAEALADLLKTPDDAAVAADMRARALRGQKTLMPKYGAAAETTAAASGDIGHGVTRTMPERGQTVYEGPGGRTTVTEDLTQAGRCFHVALELPNGNSNLGTYSTALEAQQRAAMRATNWHPGKPLPDFTPEQLIGGQP
jgi:hypothetical protein